MDLDLIKKLVKIVDTSSVTDLEIEESGLKIKIAKKIRSSQVSYTCTNSHSYRLNPVFSQFQLG